MNAPAVNVTDFLAWWRDTLLGSLPAGFRNRLQDLKRSHDFIVLRQGGDVIVLDDKGSLIESLPLSAAPVGRQASESRDQTGTVVTLANPSVGHIDLTQMQGDEGDETLATQIEDSTARVIDITLARDGDVTQELTSLTRTRLEPAGDSEEETLLFYFDNGELKTADPESEAAVDVPLMSESAGAVAGNLISEAERTLLSRYLRKGRCLYVVPSDHLLSLTVNYPAEAEQALDNALRYDLEKHIPMSVADAVYFHAIGERRSDQLQVHVEVMKKDLFQQLKQELEDLLDQGLECSTQSFRQAGGQTLPMAEGKRHSLIRAAFSRRHLLVWVNAALLAALLVLPYVYIKDRYARIEPVSGEELSRAKSIQAMKRLMESEARTRTRVVERLQQQPRVIELLNQLSSGLDKQAWLTDFLLDQDGLRIRGEADSATRVTDDLNAIGMFDDIKFVSSIVKSATSGKETFEITMKVR